jgi:hypothetical protein
MKYVSIDIETTGLDPENHEILSVGIVIEDTSLKLDPENLPTLHIGILHEEIRGSLFAINMNNDILKKILGYQGAKTVEEKAEYEKSNRMVFRKKEDVVVEIYRFLFRNGFVDFTPEEMQQSEIIDGVRYPLIGSKNPPARINAAGKNFSTFDKVFLEKLPRWKQLMRTRQRVLDPGILFVDWQNDEALPTLQTCKDRAGIQGQVTHDALEDAIDVIMVMRKFY